MKHRNPPQYRGGFFIELTSSSAYFPLMSRMADEEARLRSVAADRPWRDLPRRLLRRYVARRRLHRPIHWLGSTLFAINIVAIAFLVLDAPLGQTAKNLPHRLIAVAGTVTDAGRLVSVLTAILAAIAIGLFLAARVADRRRAFRVSSLGCGIAYVVGSVLSASIVVHILKYVIGRARPPLYDQYGILGFRPFDGDFLFQSFPSAHSTHVGALFMALALLFPRLRLTFLSLGLWLGVTRIIIGVHYPSDVAAGLALGAGFAFMAAILFSRFGLVFRKGPGGWPIPRLHSLNRRRKTIANL